MGSVGTMTDAFNGQLGSRKRISVDALIDKLERQNAINPNYLKGGAYTNNCALCSTAVGLQAQGYDVEAMPRDSVWRGFNSVFDVDWTNTDNYIVSGSDYQRRGVFPAVSASNTAQVVDSSGNIVSVRPQRMPKGANAVAKAVEDKVKSWGNGAVGYMYVKWKGYSSAHAVNVINQGGKVFIYDSQSNTKEYNLSKFFTATVAQRTNLVRLDNAPIKKNLNQDVLSKMVKKRDK